MRAFLSEKNLVVILFVMVLITFSLAQEDSKKMEQFYLGASSATVSHLLAADRPLLKSPETRAKGQAKKASVHSYWYRSCHVGSIDHRGSAKGCKKELGIGNLERASFIPITNSKFLIPLILPCW